MVKCCILVANFVHIVFLILDLFFRVYLRTCRKLTESIAKHKRQTF